MARVHPDDLDRVVDGDDRAARDGWHRSGLVPAARRGRLVPRRRGDRPGPHRRPVGRRDRRDDPRRDRARARRVDGREPGADPAAHRRRRAARRDARDDLLGGREPGPGRAVLGDAGRRRRARAADRAPRRACRPTTSRACDGVPIGPRAGSCGTAAHYGTPIVVEDIATDPRWEDYRELALEHGLAAPAGRRRSWRRAATGCSGPSRCTTATPQAPTPESDEIVAMVSPLAAIAIERKTFEDRLAYQAQHDPLTGLAEPRALRRVPDARARTRRASPDHVRGALPRPRPLQGRQRQPRPRRRRRADGEARARACAPRSGRATPSRASAATSSPCSATTCRSTDARGAGDRRRAAAARGDRGADPAQRRGPAPQREHRHRARRAG